MTTCVMRTALGKVVKMDLDVQSNRPHSMGFWLLQGTNGIFDSRFGLSLLDPQQPPDQHPEFKWEDAAPYIERYKHALWRQYGAQAESAGHGGGDFFTIREFLGMLRENREPWVDVYDAASWSAIYECSRRSLDNNNTSIEIPDFTNGRWQDAKWRVRELSS